MVDKTPYNAILGTPVHAAFELVISMSHQQVRFATKNGVGFVNSTSKSFMEYMMKSQKQQDEGSTIMEIWSILVVEVVETKKAVVEPTPNITAETSKLEEFDKVVIHPDHLDQKIQIGKEMPPHLRDEVIHFLSSHLHNFA